jgi:hypothetical protein
MPEYIGGAGDGIVSNKPQIVTINQETGEIREEGLETWDITTDEELAVGVVVPGRVKSSLRYLENTRDYNQKPESVQRQIELCNMMYYWEGIIGTTIDLFIDFAVTDLILEGMPAGSREYAICDHWLKEVNKSNNNMETGAKALAKEMLLDFFIAGNIFPFRVYGSVKGKDIMSSKVRGGIYQMPMSVYGLNPMNIHIPDHSILIGNKEIFLKFDEDLVEKLISGVDDDITRAVMNGLPPAMQAELRESGKVKLPDNQVTHIKRRSRGYEAWGRPFLARCFHAMAIKKKLQALDESTVDGLINNVVIFKVGDPEEFKIKGTRKTWSKARMAHFAALIASPNPSNYLVWTPDVDVIQVGPGDNVIAWERKYEQADGDILKALGIPTVLISGEGASSDKAENVWVAVSGLLERLDNARNQVKNYFEDILEEIVKRNKLTENVRPRLRWRKMNLRNEKEVREFVTNWWDRGVLSTRTALEELGHVDYDEKKRVRKEETKSGDDKVFKARELPFSGGGAKSMIPKAGRPPGANKPKTGFQSTQKDKKPLKRPISRADIFTDMVSTMVESGMDNISSNYTSLEDFNTLGSILGQFKQISRVFEDVCQIEKKDYENVKNQIDGIESDLTEGIMEAEGTDDSERVQDILEETKGRLVSLVHEVTNPKA